jgi:hypothetical protein
MNRIRFAAIDPAAQPCCAEVIYAVDALTLDVAVRRGLELASRYGYRLTGVANVTSLAAEG